MFVVTNSAFKKVNTGEEQVSLINESLASAWPMEHLDDAQCLKHTTKLANSLTQTSERTKKVPNVCYIPTSWDPVSHRLHSALRWCPMSVTNQLVDIESHTDIIAHLESAQCLQHTNKLAWSLTQTLCALRWCPVSEKYQQVDIEGHTDIIAHSDGAQCLQNTNKLASSLAQTS